MAPPIRTCATYDDVSLVIRLYEMRREARMREARRWFVENFNATTLDEFHALCPRGSDANASYRMVVTYWDMAASFITAGVLEPKLFFESNREMLLVWERIKAFLPGLREQYKDPQYLGNIEQVAGRFVEWMKARGPEAYPAFAERMRPR